MEFSAFNWFGLLAYLVLSGAGAALRGVLGYVTQGRPQGEQFLGRKFYTTVLNGFLCGGAYSLVSYLTPEVPSAPGFLAGSAAFWSGFALDAINKDAVRVYLFAKLGVTTWEEALPKIGAALERVFKRS